MRDILLRQLDTSWKLASHHLDGLTTAECLWRPADRGLTVTRGPAGRWRAEWPEHEGYSLGPPSIAWLTWHIGFWWSMAFDHAFGTARLRREDIDWPGDAEEVRRWLQGLHDRWLDSIAGLGEDELQSTQRVRWPFRDLPLGDLVAWANLELAKNAAEIGYARFLYATRAS